MQRRSKTLLVTGATGYLAANFLNYAMKSTLIEAYDYVFLLDRNLKLNRLSSEFSSPRIYKFSLNLAEIPLAFTEQYLAYEELYGSVLERSEVDILHFAYLANLDLEIAAIKSLIENLKLCRFIYLSSSAVYGENDTQPLRLSLESDIPKPISEYGFTKLAIEEYLKSVLAEKQILILRLANPFYGEFSTRGVYQFFRQQLMESRSGDAFTLSINAESERQIIRDFIHINKFNSLMGKCLLSKFYGIYNLASSEPTYLEDFAEIAKANLLSDRLLSKEEAQKNIEFKYLGFKAGDIKVSCLSTEKINS